MNITVYLGSSFGKDEAFSKCAAELGTWIGKNGHTLVYGGSKDGLMGILADHVLAAGGEVIGVMPRFLIERDRAHHGLKHFAQVTTMAERKARMVELGDAYIALPGGPGTLEEISEVISAGRLALHQKPCILLNINGYYDTLAALFAGMEQNGFVRREEMKHVYTICSLSELEVVLNKVSAEK